MLYTAPGVPVHPALQATGTQLRLDSLANVGLVNDVLAKYNPTLHLGTP